MANPVTDQLQSYIFGGSTGVPTADELQRRRQISVALAMRQKPYPKTVGEGLTALGEGIGDRWNEERLLAGEKAVRQQAQSVQQANPLPGGVPGPVTPPGAPVAPAVAPGRTDAPDAAPVAPVASVDPGRNAIAAALPAAQGVLPANPTQSEADQPPTTSQADVRGGQDDEAIWRARQNAIGSIESGGQKDPYQALGPVTPKGDRAFGRYQVMGANIPSWTKAALGTPLTPQQFLSDPEAQDAVFKHRFGSYVDKYGDEGAARAWYGGEHGMHRTDATDHLGRMTVGGYGQTYLQRLQGAQRGAPTAALTTGVTSDAPPVGMPTTPPVGADAEENPPTSTDIKPMPTVLAQAGGAPAGPLPPNAPVPTSGPMGVVPGPTAPRVPLQFPAPLQATPPAPQFAQPKTPPVAPLMQTDLSPEELKGIAIQQQAPDNPAVQAWGQKFIDFGAARRKAEYDRATEDYRGKLANWNAQSLAEAEYARNFPQTQEKFKQAQEDRARAEWEAAQFPFGKEKTLAMGKESFDKVSNIPASQFAINGVKQMLTQDPKMFTGADANIRSSIERLGIVLGKPANPALSNTQAFQAMITPIISQLRSAIVGSGAQSEAEFRNLERAAGSDITLERPAIEKILGSIERLNVMAATQHQKRLLVNSAGDPNVRANLFGNYELPMEDVIPQRTIDILRKNVAADPSKAATEIDNFDRDFHTPGLAAKILQRGR